MQKNRVGFFFFFFFLCQIWAKNLLKFLFNGLKQDLHDLYMRLDCIPPEFSPFRNFKKNMGKLNSLTVRKKKLKKNPDRPTQFFNFGRVRATWIFFFFFPHRAVLYHTMTMTMNFISYMAPHGRMEEIQTWNTVNIINGNSWQNMRIYTMKSYMSEKGWYWMEKEGIKGDLQTIFKFLYLKVPAHKSITHWREFKNL